MSVLGRAESRGIRSAPLWQLALLVISCEVSLALAALNDSPQLRLALSLGAVAGAGVILPTSVLGQPELRAIVPESAGTSVMSDLILLVASCVVWRGQNAYEDLAMEWFRVFGTAAAGIGAVGPALTTLWFKKQPYLPRLLVSIVQLANGASQLLLASLLFPRSPKSQFVYTVPLFLISGFAVQFFWDLAIKPAAPPAQPPAAPAPSTPAPSKPTRPQTQ